MNIDAALRYYPVIKTLVKDQNGLKILEVGSGTNGITDFYSGKIIGLDCDFARTKTKKNQNMVHVKGSVLNMPLEDKTFDVVLCFDTYEHINLQDRLLALKEMVRVTKKGGTIYLGFPTGTLSSFAEKFINNLFRLTHKSDHPWLKEHFENGLPIVDEVYGYLKEIKVGQSNVRVAGNVNLFFWIFLHSLVTVNENNKIGRVIRLIQEPLYHFGKIALPPYYRAIFVIKKI